MFLRRSKLGQKYSKKEVEDWQPRLKEELSALKRLPENRHCFDCGVQDVTWASPKLGTFICAPRWTSEVTRKLNRLRFSMDFQLILFMSFLLIR